MILKLVIQKLHPFCLEITASSFGMVKDGSQEYKVKHFCPNKEEGLKK